MLGIYYGIIAFAIFLFLTLGIVINKKCGEKWLNTFLIVASSVIGACFLFRYMLGGDDVIRNVFKLGGEPFNNIFQNFIAVLITWFTYGATLLVVLYAFFKSKLTKMLVKCVSLPVLFLSIALFRYLSLSMEGGIGGFSVRVFLMALEVGFGFAYSLMLLIWDIINRKSENENKLFINKSRQVQWDFKKPAKVQNKFLNFIKICLSYSWQFIKFICSCIAWFFERYWFQIFVVLVVLFSVMPAYTLQAIFGLIPQSYTCKDLEIPHRIILYIGIVIPFIIYFTLKNKDYQTKKFLLLYICLGTLITFSLNHKFVSFLDPVNWPLHLCNTAMYIMPVVLIFNMKKFFYFTYFINVAGAFLAMVMPNYSTGANMFSTNLLVFYVNHYIAFFMPILFVALRMFEIPKLKQFIYSMVAFLVYFVLIIIVNAYFTGLFEIGKLSSGTDYFFVNSDFIAEKLGKWCENLRNNISIIKVGEVSMKFYPIYQILFFIGYVVIGLAVWFIYEQTYQISASVRDISARLNYNKQERLALLSELKGRSIFMPINPENENKLVLKNFSKKYGASDVFAVKDANLEINGGEIFGFLGPNGAGKSTIIKSIVGIQPITSGEINVCGYDVNKQSVMAKRNIGFVPDHYALYEKLTGREYINYIADLYNVSTDERTEKINNYVKKFELEGAFDNQIKTYSHGMKQKITILAALVHNPKVWILDEPLTGLDPNSIYQVKECMKEHAKQGNIVFFSSHIIDVVERICDRVAIIKKGKILTCKTVKEIEDGKVSLEDFYMSTINQKVGENSNDKK